MPFNVLHGSALIRFNLNSEVNLLITFLVCTSLALKENCLIEIERRYEFSSVKPLGAMRNSMLWVYWAVPKNNKILRVLMPVTVMCMCGQLQGISMQFLMKETLVR